MSAWDSADARAAFMATYFSRYPYPQAGTKYTTTSSPSTPLRRYDTNAPDRRTRQTRPKESFSSLQTSDGSNRFATRGRTIYNAQADPVAVSPATTAAYPTISDAPFRYDRETAAPNTSLSALGVLQKIDAEEEWKRNHPGYQFLMAAAKGHADSEDWHSVEGHSFDADGSNSIRGTPTRSRGSTPSLMSPSSGSDSESDFDYAPSAWDTGVMDVDDMRAQEMFDLYIKAEECAGQHGMYQLVNHFRLIL
ncbi:hypothetical protein HYDPIDRAFT_106752 [Hydnomerulius pinastri MD-312]|nr:hypothetical protein HYDPIDRAFT_106752 [Hydnomerulius pinastri MD-312]